LTSIARSGQFFAIMRKISSAAPLFAVGLALATAACAPAADLRGNAPDKQTLKDIKPGVTDKASVTQLLGSPSSIATFDTNTWYYISQETVNVAFFKPELTDQHVVAINFDDKGLVTKIALLDMKDREIIEPNPKATPAPGREFTILEQLVGNFGRFAAPSPANTGGTSQPGPGH
jgi:outer membrane protein assembly factor BamE (lipoprotein component of BamABCDE complex)